MGLIDRFTRDEVSAKIWWPFALLLIVLFVLTFPAANRAAEQRRADVAAWTVAVAPQVEAAYRADNSLSPSALASSVDSAPPSIRAIRVWDGADGKLLASSDGNDSATLQSGAALNDDQLAAASREQSQPVPVIGRSL